MSPREKSLSKAVLSYGLLPHFFLYRSCLGKESIIQNFLSFKESGLFPAGLLHVFPLGEKQHSCRLSTFAFSEFRCIESWVRHAMRRRVSAWSRIRENLRYKREGTKLGKFLLDLNPLKKHYWRTEQEQNSSVEGLDGSNSSQARQVLLDLLFWLLSYGRKLVNLDFIRNRVHKSTFGLQKGECHRRLRCGKHPLDPVVRYCIKRCSFAFCLSTRMN